MNESTKKEFVTRVQKYGIPTTPDTLVSLYYSVVNFKVHLTEHSRRVTS